MVASLLPLLLAACLPPPASSPPPHPVETGGIDDQDTGSGWEDVSCDGWDADLAAGEQAALDAANTARAAGAVCFEGRFEPTGALVMNEALRCAARLHSVDMAVHDMFSHTGTDGSDVSRRVEAQGYTTWTTLGENIAAGHDDADATIAQWLASDQGHCANLMDPDFTEAGIGLYHDPSSEFGWYWTMDLGARGR